VSRSRRVVLSLLGCLLAVVTTTAVTAAPASAFGGETFGCRVAPGHTFTWSEFCTNDSPANQYNVGFAVLNTSGAYSFSWQITGSYQSVFTGCTSTSSDCALLVGRGYRELSVTVTYTQNGQSATRTAYADIEPFCGSQLC
jgi:hypothetical protein